MTDIRKYVDLTDKQLRLLDIPEGRRELTRLDPLLFALIYLPDHLKNESGDITLSEFHEDLVDYGKSWAKPLRNPKEHRDAFIAPRESGKTTWLFLLLPMWAAAHEHVRFIAAYSESANQAQGHLLTFKHELGTNKYLRHDFPDLCEPEKTSQNRALAHNNWKIVQDNGFVFTASGVDVSNHGIKHGRLRPQLIILDDIEPGESNYSDYQMKQRLSTIWDDIAPQNIYARMVIVGTTTMANSIMDQLRKYAEDGMQDGFEWIEQQNIAVHYYPAIIDDRSLWPEKWPLDWLKSQRKLRDFAKNYMNKPIPLDGQFWSEEDIEIENGDYGNTIISVDPAVTKSKVSDYTGVAVVSRGDDGVYIRYARQIKATSKELAELVSVLVDKYNAGLIYVETNQGGDLWRDVFSDIPCKYRSNRQTESKEIRAGKALNFYQRGKVKHTDHFPELHEQMLAFPRVANDDVLDAVTSGVLYFLDQPESSVELHTINYLQEKQLIGG